MGVDQFDIDRIERWIWDQDDRILELEKELEKVKLVVAKSKASLDRRHRS